MRKPNWTEPRGSACQWPRCKLDGEVKFSHGATKWIDREDGVHLCDDHHATMSAELFPDPVGPEVGSTVTLKATDDYPAEKVVVLDWWENLGVKLLVDDGSGTPAEVPYSECEEHSTSQP